MMDFGFGAFLEKFEANFGGRLTKVLLAIMGIAIAVTCTSAIWSLLVQPLLKIASEFSPSWASAVQIMQWIMMPLAAAVAAAIVQAIFESIFQARIAALRRDLQSLSEEHVRGQRGVIDRLTVMDLAFDNMLNGAAEKGLVSQEVKELLGHLRSEVAETQAQLLESLNER